MLLFALAGGGSFTTSTVSEHAKTNAEVIGNFLLVSTEFSVQERAFLCSMRSVL